MFFLLEDKREVVIHCSDGTLYVEVQLSLGEWVEDGEASIINTLRRTVSAIYLYQVAVLDTILVFQVLKGLPIDIQPLHIHYPAIFTGGLLQLLKDRKRRVLDGLITVLVVA